MPAGKNTSLQRLRKDAGYPTAKAFAEAIGLPVSTYARYEQSADNITLKAATDIADFLDASLDAVVGRNKGDDSFEDDGIREVYENLSDIGKGEVKRALTLIQGEELRRQSEYDKCELQRYMKFAKCLEDRFYDEAVNDSSSELAYRLFLSGDNLRDEFEEYVALDFDFINHETCESNAENAKEYLRSQHCSVPVYDENDDEIYDVLPDDEEYEEALAQWERHEYKRRVQESMGNSTRIIDGIMKAFDLLHSQKHEGEEE